MFSTGHGWTILATGIAFPLLADIIMKSGNYHKLEKDGDRLCGVY